MLDHLGSGEFGEVYKGKLEKTKGLVLEVAVKTVKYGPKEEQGRKALLQEAALMAQFKHPNIITMYGVCTAEKVGPLSIKPFHTLVSHESPTSLVDGCHRVDAVWRST